MATESFTKEFRITRKNYKNWVKAFRKPNHTPIQRPEGRVEFIEKGNIKKFLGMED